jgi:hypothetical protein
MKVLYILILILLVTLYIKKKYYLENFYNVTSHRLNFCSELQNVINILFDISIRRHNIFKNNLSKHNKTRRKPILFYFWGSKDNLQSEVFKSKDMNKIDSFGDKLKNSAYGTLRNELENLFKNFQIGNKSLFKSKEFSLFKQEYSDLEDILDPEELKKKYNAENYNKQKNLLRIIDMDVTCSYTNNNSKQIFHTCDTNDYLQPVDSSCCCWIDGSTKNKGMVYDESSSHEIKNNRCCHYLEYLRFIPESQFIIKLIYNGIYAYLENSLEEFKKNNNVSDEEDKYKIDNLDPYDFTKKVPIINTLPSLVLWDGHGIDATEINKGTIKILGYNGKPDLEIKLPTGQNHDLWQFKPEELNSEQFKDFIKYHIHLYREDVTNFFEFLCLRFLKEAKFNGNGNFAESGGETGKFIVKNNNIQDLGYNIISELYKYHIKNEVNYNHKKLKQEAIYQDFHFDYNTLTKYYGNNACKYYDMKLYYERFNIQYNWEISDIIKFVTKSIGDPYEIFSKSYKSKIGYILGKAINKYESEK